MDIIKLPHDIKEYIKRKKMLHISACVILLTAVVAILACWGEMLFGGFGKYNMIGIYAILILLPIAITKAPIYLFARNWKGIVSNVELKTINSFKRGTKIMIKKILLEVTIDREDGKRIIKTFEEVNPFSMPKDWSETSTDYRVGSEIYHIVGLKYPLVVHKGHNESVKCVVCGLRNPCGNERCGSCGHSLIER